MQGQRKVARGQICFQRGLWQSSQNTGAGAQPLNSKLGFATFDLHDLDRMLTFSESQSYL